VREGGGGLLGMSLRALTALRSREPLGIDFCKVVHDQHDVTKRDQSDTLSRYRGTVHRGAGTCSHIALNGA
jgi:hypothetical protein